MWSVNSSWLPNSIVYYPFDVKLVELVVSEEIEKEHSRTLCHMSNCILVWSSYYTIKYALKKMGKRQNVEQLHSLLVIQKSSDCKCALRVAPANRLGWPAGAVICNSTSASAKQSVADSFHILARIFSIFWGPLISCEIFWDPLTLRSLWDPMLTISTIGQFDNFDNFD